jgi:bisphosphoglycerate-dependent phosphoglycerate mutase
MDFNLPTATPLVYEFDDDLKLIRSYFDIDPDTLK